MTYRILIDEKKSDFDGALGHFAKESNTIRTGRANPALVDSVFVDYYGAKTSLKQMANISVPEPRVLLVQPWARDTIAAIENAIRTSDLGLNPSNDGAVIRIVLPALTEERRKDLVKVLNQKAEEAKVSVRAVREDAWSAVQERSHIGGMSEDDKFRGKDYLQKIVDEYNKKIEEMREKKEKEIMTV